MTLFFAELVIDGPVRDARTDIDFINVNGQDLEKSQNVGIGVGKRFSDSDLTELSRRSRIALDKLKEAWGIISMYRLHGRLLQKRIYSRSCGTFEYFTVVPEGNWRTVEFGADRRRLSLRRHVVLVFHNTPMGPHRSRDRTAQAIMDAGL